MRNRIGRRWMTVVATVGVVVAMTAPVSEAAELPTWPANPNWQSLVPAPSSGDVRPVSVVRTHGSVTNPTALTGGGGSTVLTATSGSPAIVVLDFGREVGGNPYVTVSSTSVTTTLGVATSEALGFLTRPANGIYTNDNGSAVTFSVTGPRTYSGGLRGGFRFAAEPAGVERQADQRGRLPGLRRLRLRGDLLRVLSDHRDPVLQILRRHHLHPFPAPETQPGTLAWTQGQVPTVHGSLVVRWAQDAGQFHLQVVAPAGTSGEVWVPGTSTPLTPGTTFLRRAGNYDVYRVGSGTVEFSSTS